MEIGVQFLEGGHDWSGATTEAVRQHLRQAGEQLPFESLMIGWDLPERLVEACAEEALHQGVKLFRWQPLLTGDGKFQPRPEWQTIGLSGGSVAGFAGMPEFTFVCPNRPAVQEILHKHIQEIIQDGRYQGVFLDRIRFPSPAADLWSELACFCPDCHAQARKVGLDLEEARIAIQSLMVEPEGALSLARLLLGTRPDSQENGRLQAVDAFLAFRQTSITHLLQSISKVIWSNGLEVGLDCFSPCLSRMVGQDLPKLDACCDWIKIMTYGRTLGPAGLPFELGRIAEWLYRATGLDDSTILKQLSEFVGFDLPMTRTELREKGLESSFIQKEVRAGKEKGIRRLLGGLALVELRGVNEMTDEQVQADVKAFRQSGADGLVISWDLWHIPVHRLSLLRKSAS